MKINNIPAEVARPDAVQKSQSVTQGNSQGETQGVSRQNDQVQISDAGRALANGGTSESNATSTLDPQRAEEIRTRILSGAYNSLSMAHQVAQAILNSGDL
jgi:anti-sigma28 factor (negative regulator of flagellin synthesis)